MPEYNFLGILVLIFIFFLHNFLAPKINFAHLQTTVYAIVFALPFERIPTIELAGVNLKISYILTIIGVYIVGVLIAKQNAQILETNLNWWHFLGLVFLVFSSYSWFSVMAPTRFFATFAATIIVILASILVSLFTKDIFKALKLFSISMVLTQLFGLYQFAGDMLNIPCNFTGLRCNFYTKDVFGIPRIHSTAIEPQHYATFCTWMIFFSSLCLIYKVNLFEKIQKLKFFAKHFQIVNFSIFLLSCLLLLLTVSKGAIAIFLGIIPLFILAIFRKQDIFQFLSNSWSQTKASVRNLISIGAIGFFGILVILANIETTPIAKIWRDVLGTFAGDSPTSIERNNFVNQALSVLPENVLSGIGFGQFGNAASTLPSLIVNNVYLEVWLESGFLALLVFIVIFFAPLFLLGKQMFWQNSMQQPLKVDDKLTQEIIGLTLFFSLLLALIQWTIFSPLYIMPFYILLGLVVNFNNNYVQTN